MPIKIGVMQFKQNVGVVWLIKRMVWGACGAPWLIKARCDVM